MAARRAVGSALHPGTERRKDMGSKKVWLVLVDDTHTTSTRHPTLESAMEEAERLLRLPMNASRGVTILEAVEYGQLVDPTPPVLWTNLRGKEAAIPPDPSPRPRV